MLGSVKAQRLVFMQALGTAVGSAVGLHVGALLGAWLLKQSSAQSLCDCPQLELSSQAGLCHQNTNNQVFSTDLIFMNWDIASNAQLGSRPLDFVMMHLMHKDGITTIVSCCRDVSLYRT